jgi:ADP-heptose:LPS heptosyltransferase
MNVPDGPEDEPRQVHVETASQVQSGAAEGLSSRQEHLRRLELERLLLRTNGRDPRHILAVLLCPIGDTLLATPALAALRRRFPDARITAVVSDKNADILDDNPDISDRIVLPPPGTAPTALRFAAGVHDLRQQAEGCDVAFCFSAASSFTILAAGLGCPEFHVPMPSLWWLAGSRSESYRERHTIDQFLLALWPAVELPQDPEARVPRLHLTLKDRSAARRLLREHGISPSHVLVTMHVGAEGFDGRKQWAPERFAEVANALIERFDARVLLIGGGSDLPLVHETARLIPEGATILAGKASLKVSGALIEHSTLFIGNDSAPLHMAAAAGTPAVGIFGPSDWNQFHPIGKPGYAHRVVHSDLPCSPCFHFLGNDPPWVHNLCYTRACLKAIAPQQVLDAAVTLLAARAESSNVRL